MSDPYIELLENCDAGVNSNVYHKNGEDQWHVSSFKHKHKINNFYESDWQYEVQVWKGVKGEKNRTIWFYRKCHSLNEAAMVHLRAVNDIRSGRIDSNDDE